MLHQRHFKCLVCLKHILSSPCQAPSRLASLPLHFNCLHQGSYRLPLCGDVTQMTWLLPPFGQFLHLASGAHSVQIFHWLCPLRLRQRSSALAGHYNYLGSVFLNAGSSAPPPEFLREPIWEHAWALCVPPVPQVVLLTRLEYAGSVLRRSSLCTPKIISASSTALNAT